MAGHDNEYVIRLPETFWQNLIDRRYMAAHLGPRALEIFMTAQQGRCGGGYARYIKGSLRSVNRILIQLRSLQREIKAGDLAAHHFGLSRSDIDRWAHQLPRLADTVRIIPPPDPKAS